MSDTAAQNQLQIIVEESGLEKTKAQYLLDNFTAYFEIAAVWEAKAKTIVVTDESQTAEMKIAREGRMFLRDKRIALEKARKELKSQSLREGKAIDGIANVLKALIVPIEQHLDTQEHYVENKRAKEEEDRRAKAEKALQEKEEAERVEQEKQMVKERAEREKEEQRIRAENKKLREETAAKEAALQKEREASEKAIAAERLKSLKESETAACAARIKAEKKATKERKELEAKLAEQHRLASMVTCPECGHCFSTKENS